MENDNICATPQLLIGNTGEGFAQFNGMPVLQTDDWPMDKRAAFTVCIQVVEKKREDVLKVPRGRECSTCGPI
jgi:hypothetical protein